MRQGRARRAGARGAGARKQRRRPVPKWLQDPKKLDAVAHSRCMMVLAVLSGEAPVSEAIAQARISRGTYYQLETRALNAMLSALNPLASAKRGRPADLSAHRIEALMQRVRALEQDKRRMKRLLLLSRKAREPNALEERLARQRRRARLGLMPHGHSSSAISTPKAMSPPRASTTTKAGESVP
jgi:hypothetical protein